MSQNCNQESILTKNMRNITKFKFNKIENITQKQKKINLAKIKCIIMKSEGITS